MFPWNKGECKKERSIIGLNGYSFARGVLRGHIKSHFRGRKGEELAFPSNPTYVGGSEKKKKATTAKGLSGGSADVRRLHSKTKKKEKGGMRHFLGFRTKGLDSPNAGGGVGGRSPAGKKNQPKSGRRLGG